MDMRFRCDCPITSALDILGDRWIMVIIKLMLIEGKKTFKEFIESDEAIATNILSTKLKLLEELGMVTKSKLPDNKKTNIYTLSKKAVDLAPTIMELALWSDKYIRPMNPIMQNPPALKMMREDRSGFLKSLTENYHQKITS